MYSALKIASFSKQFITLALTMYILVFTFEACTSSTEFDTPRTTTNVLSDSTITGSTTGTMNGTTNGTMTVTAPPVITSFTPTSVTAGTVVHILGTGFTGTSAVTIGGVAVTSFTVVSDGQISAVVHPNSMSGSVSVTTSRGVAARSGLIVTSAPPQSSVTQISSFLPPSTGAGTEIAILGSGFTGATAVSIGGVPVASFKVVTPSLIEAVVGAGASGSVSVTTPSGTASLAGFTLALPPTITSFTPTTAPNGGIVTINGTNFTTAVGVKFGDVYARTYTIVSPTQIIATVSTGATGSVSVRTLAGIATLAGFTFLP